MLQIEVSSISVYTVIMFIEWVEEYGVGVESIDRQHKKFILILNKLSDALDEGTEDTALGEILDELVVYTDYHFATEEKILRQTHCEFYDEQVAEHRKLRKHLTELVMKSHKNRSEVSLELLHFMKDWLTKHLLQQDQKYSSCFIEHGIK